MTKRTPRRDFLIREVWAARRLGLIMPGVPLDSIPFGTRGLVQHARKLLIEYRTARALERSKGPMLP